MLAASFLVVLGINGLAAHQGPVDCEQASAYRYLS
ncbi:MAG: hypothetical protein K0S56_2312 [Microvirga sp.]|nr:hypothetical protein [Microvirga sp.]